MKLPFVYGRLAENENFTDRELEYHHLLNNFRGLTNSILISPRRWGKTSLVNKVLSTLSEDPNYYVAHVDIFNCQSLEDFYKTYTNAILRASSSKMEDFLNSVRKYLSSFSPKLSISDSINSYEISFGVDYSQGGFTPDEILDLPQKIAEEHGKSFVVCIDEFQNINDWGDSLAIQRKLRSHWQRHRSVCYCLYGSKRHMLLDIFGNNEKPFYKFGDILFLDKISDEKWLPFISGHFSRQGKTISDELILDLVHRVDNHPYYVQQLAQQVWLRCEQECTSEIVQEAHESVVDQLSLLFANIYDSLTVRQIEFLRAVANNERNYSSQSVLKRYNLGSSANIKNLRNALLERDIIDVLPNGRIEFQDPVFKFWLMELHHKEGK